MAVSPLSRGPHSLFCILPPVKVPGAAVRFWDGNVSQPSLHTVEEEKKKREKQTNKSLPSPGLASAHSPSIIN